MGKRKLVSLVLFVSLNAWMFSLFPVSAAEPTGDSNTTNPEMQDVSIKTGEEKYTSIDVDYSVDNGVSHRVASGALHGIDYKTPAEYLSDGIYIKALRGQAKHHEQDNGYEYLPGFLYEKTYNRVIERGDDTKLMIGLYYGYKPLANQVGGWQSKALENNGKFWKDYIHDFMGEYYNEDGTTNRDVYSWIPWNEPDLQWGGITDNFCKAYENAYDAVKEVDPSARVQGPECSWYEGGKMKNFLLYCKENNCLPEVLSWHELQPYKLAIAAHCKEMYDFMIANNIEPMEMAVTEYQGLGYDEDDEGRRRDGNYNTGLAVSYISELENAEQYGMNYGLRSAWSYGGSDPRAKAYLGEMTDVETATMPTGLWYVYNAYKRMTGRKAGVTITDPDNDDAVSALAASDSTVEGKSSTILVGNWKSGNTDDHEAAKNIKVTLKNIPDYLIADGKVNVKIEQFEETLAVPLYSPTVISDKTYEVTNGAVELEAAELYGRRAMAVTVTTPETAAESVNMSTLDPQGSDGVAIDTSDGYVKAVGGKAPTYIDETQEAPALTTTYKDNGSSVTFTAAVPEAGQYNLRITHKTGAENGFMQLYVDDKAVCYPIDLYSEADGEKAVNYGNVYLTAGEHKLCFKIVGYGKNRKSRACTLTFGDMTLAKLQDTGVTKVVAFDPAGGKVSQTSMLVNDKPAQLPEVTREGYKFLGWFDKDGNQFTENTAVSESMTVTARWEQSYTVRLIGNRDICGLAYDETAKKAVITINAAQGSEINVTANNEDISDRLVYENGKYVLNDYEINKDTVFIVNIVIPEPDSYDPYIQNEAEKYTESNSIQTEVCDEGGSDVGFIVNGSWLMYKKMDFGSNGAARFEARVASAGSGGKIELRLDSVDGPVIGTVDAANTGGWQNWVTKSCDVHDVTGIHNLYLTMSGGSGNLFNINWWRFTEAINTEDSETIYKQYLTSNHCVKAEGIAADQTNEGLGGTEQIMVYNGARLVIENDRLSDADLMRLSYASGYATANKNMSIKVSASDTPDGAGEEICSFNISGTEDYQTYLTSLEAVDKAKAAEKRYLIIDMSGSGQWFFDYIEFVRNAAEKPLPDTVIINKENGRISVTSDYSKDYDFDMYTALYDADGKLAGIRKNEPSSAFDVSEGKYTVKVFFWNGMEPVFKSKTKSFE